MKQKAISAYTEVKDQSMFMFPLVYTYIISHHFRKNFQYHKLPI